MKRYVSLVVAAAAMVSMTLPTAALAQSWDWHRGYGEGWHDGYNTGGEAAYDTGYDNGEGDDYEDGWDDGWRNHNHRTRDAVYDDDYEYHPHYICRRESGTGGLILGALAGGLFGREIAGDRTAGTIIGGGVGALAGRALDRQGHC